MVNTNIHIVSYIRDKIKKHFKNQGDIQIIEATDDKIIVCTDKHGLTFTFWNRIGINKKHKDYINTIKMKIL